MPEKLWNYNVIRTLGEGAKSTIYAVSDPDTGQLYALKHVLRNVPKDIRFIEQMEAEFEISQQFNHPNLRRSYALKLHRSLLMKVTEAFLLMELFDGTPLDVRPPESVLQAVEIFIATATGLRAMHQLGYAHCDIKPNNILRSDSGEVKVIDFGQSCRLGTIKERIQGTPDYIAPEQVNRRPVVMQTDVYNLGATLYWSLTGKPIPTLYTVNKQGENSFLLDSAIQTPSDLNPQIPVTLSNFVMECIATRKEKRPPDMDSVITRLEIAHHNLTKKTDAPPTPA
jgi:serine/threonine-protein kinase